VQQVIEKPYDRQDLARAIRAAVGAGRPSRDTRAPKAAADTEDPAVPLFEIGVLNQLLTDLGIERCQRIVESYQSSAPRLFKAMARGIADDDLAAASEAAHQLISAASFVGLTAIAKEARRLHRCCAAHDTREARTVLARLQSLDPQGIDALTGHWERTIKYYGARA